ncbi:MAG: pseudouridine-5'-phosphate glycosidase [Endozoicomonas sp.]
MSETSSNKYLDIHPAVAEALNNQQPVVALESTALTHGFPYPDNLQLFRKLLETLETEGVQPAITAILDGRIKVGLSTEQLDKLAATGSSSHKASRRDIAPLLASGLTGGTTVAATMVIATMVGIRLMATGGIGGVHRGAEQNFDISADLQELAKSPVTVVCSGPKAILDLALTREYLETMGVPVIGYRTKSLPAFYSVSSSEAVDYLIKTPDEAARLIEAHKDAGLQSGQLICNPIPESFAIPLAEAETAIVEAISLARREGVSGKALTPFLLQHLFRSADHRFLKANKALLKNNVQLAAEISKRIH